MQSCMYMKALNFELFSVLKTSQNTVRFGLFSRLNGYFLHNNTLAIILHVYIMILTWVESIFTLVICDNYTINIIFSSKYRWGSNFRSNIKECSVIVIGEGVTDVSLLGWYSTMVHRWQHNTTCSQGVVLKVNLQHNTKNLQHDLFTGCCVGGKPTTQHQKPTTRPVHRVLL